MVAECATCGAGLGAWLVRLTAGPPTASSLVVGCELAECAAGGVGCGRPTAPAAPGPTKLPLVSSSGLAKVGHGHQFALNRSIFDIVLITWTLAIPFSQWNFSLLTKAFLGSTVPIGYTNLG